MLKIRIRLAHSPPLFHRSRTVMLLTLGAQRKSVVLPQPILSKLEEIVKAGAGDKHLVAGCHWLCDYAGVSVGQDVSEGELSRELLICERSVGRAHDVYWIVPLNNLLAQKDAPGRNRHCLQF